MRFRLCTLHLLVLAAGIGLGAYLPARERYLHWQTVRAIRVEVDSSLAAASAMLSDSPDLAMLDLQWMRESVLRTPILYPHERQPLLAKIDAHRDRARREVGAANRRFNEYQTSCNYERQDLSDNAEE